MSRRHDIKPLVKDLLTRDEIYRNDDTKLRWRIWMNLGYLKRNDAGEAYMTYSAERSGAPDPETIRRARQKVQEEHPELGPTDPKVIKARRWKEDTRGDWVNTAQATEGANYRGASA